MCSETGGVPPWSHHTAKRDWLSALGGIECEVPQDDGMADFSNQGTAVLPNDYESLRYSRSRMAFLRS
jgi:hypothetical protein